MSVWNPDNIKDVAESVGISSLSEEVLQGLSSDIEYRLAQVLEEALKFMRHSKRTTLWTQDIAQALRTLDVEPLYGYESTRPLRFGEASIGPGQPLFYVEDEEMDLEKLINAPLPKVPREMSLTGKLGIAFSRILIKSLHSALASCRRRPALNPPKPYNSRLSGPRACSQRPWRKFQPRRHQRQRQRHRQASSATHPLQRTPALFWKDLSRPP